MATATLAVIDADRKTETAFELQGKAAPVRFHMSLNVSDLDRSVAFYRVLFGVEPAKCRPDYAKFELDEPPLVMSLEPHAPGAGGMLNHAGFRFPNAIALVEAQRRLELAGFPTQREEGVECCYAKQTKFWARDPDLCLWEFYTLEEDIDHRGAGQVPEKIPAAAQPSAPAVAAASGPVFEHRMDKPLPKIIPGEPSSYGEIRLRGTLNLPLGVGQPQELFAEALRMLKPGGQLHLHVLTASSPFPDGPPQLPGPASAVKATPVDRDLLSDLEHAGFQGMVLTKFKSQPCFRISGVELRETMISARKPTGNGTASGNRLVVYRGPFASISDESGRVFRRGERVSVPEEVGENLSSAAPDQFTVLEATAEHDSVQCG